VVSAPDRSDARMESFVAAIFGWAAGDSICADDSLRKGPTDGLEFLVRGGTLWPI